MNQVENIQYTAKKIHAPHDVIAQFGEIHKAHIFDLVASKKTRQEMTPVFYLDLPLEPFKKTLAWMYQQVNGLDSKTEGRQTLLTQINKQQHEDTISLHNLHDLGEDVIEMCFMVFPRSYDLSSETSPLYFPVPTHHELNPNAIFWVMALSFYPLSINYAHTDSPNHGSGNFGYGVLKDQDSKLTNLFYEHRKEKEAYQALTDRVAFMGKLAQQLDKAHFNTKQATLNLFFYFHWMNGEVTFNATPQAIHDVFTHMNGNTRKQHIGTLLNILNQEKRQRLQFRDYTTAFQWVSKFVKKNQ